MKKDQNNIMKYNKSENEVYIVSVFGGYPDDCYNSVIFVTFSEKIAQDYVSKFNRILAIAKKHKKKFENEDEWLKAEYYNDYYDRWNIITKTHSCFYTKNEFRRK